MGLQSCWLGGTFKRDMFSEAMQVTADEVIPAVSPIGYAARSRSVIDGTLRLLASSKQRKPWSQLFYADNVDTPLLESDAGSYATVLEMVRLAPSASNKQPWRILREKSAFHIFLQRSKGGHDFGVDFQRIDMGIALCHFELAARELSLAGSWNEVKPAPGNGEKWEYILTWLPS